MMLRGSRSWLIAVLCGLAFTLGHAQEAINICVWPFDSRAIGTAGAAVDSELLGAVLPDFLQQELQASPRLRLVERQRLDAVLSELKLGSSELSDPAARLKLGHLLGARWMAFGSLLYIGTAWQLDVRIVDVDGAEVVATASTSGSGGQYQQAIHQIGVQLLDHLH